MVWFDRQVVTGHENTYHPVRCYLGLLSLVTTNDVLLLYYFTEVIV